MVEIELEVDGQRIELVDTIRLFQRAPFPGGHTYRLSVRGSALSSFTKFGIVPAGSLLDVDQQRVFSAIESVVAGIPGEGQVPARFILTSVDRVLCVDDTLAIFGLCSVPT